MLVCHVITGLGDGGAEAMLFRLCTHRQAVWRHLVIALGPEEKYAPMLRQAGVETYCLGLPRGRLDASAFTRLVGLLRDRAPTVVQTWMYHANLVGGIAAKLAGCRRVVWGLHHTELAMSPDTRRTRIVNRVCAWTSGCIPTDIVACGEAARAAHERHGYSRWKFAVVNNGCDVREFSPDQVSGNAIRRELDCGPTTPVVAFIGRWHADKDHANLIAAFAHVIDVFRDAKLVLVGRNCTGRNAAMMKLVHQAGIEPSVHLLGERRDVPAIMNALDLHVLPSRSEAFPLVVVEAMACGKPCVVTDVGDAGLIVGSEGWVVPPANSEALAAAIVDALKLRLDPLMWQKRGAAARNRILDKFSLDRLVEGYAAVWGAGSRQPGR